MTIDHESLGVTPMPRKRFKELTSDTASQDEPGSTFETRAGKIGGIIVFLTGVGLLLYGLLRYDWSDASARPVILSSMILGLIACAGGASLLVLASLKNRR